MKFILSFVCCALSFIVGCSGSGGGGGEGKTAPQKLQQLLEKSVGPMCPGIALYVKTPDYTFNGVAGLADEGNKIPLTKDHLFRIASSSKTFLGVLTVMSHLEGRLDLEDRITDYLPQSILSRFQNTDRITIRQLLNHTSGIPDVGRDVDFMKAVYNDPYIEYTDEQVIAFMYDKPADFLPDADFSYSNTGYLLLGLILDNVYGYHHAIALRDKILTPLSLASTHYEDHEVFTEDIAHGYAPRDGVKVDVYAYESEYGHAFGGLLSNAEDIARFIETIIVDPTFPSPDQKQEFLDLLLPPKPSGFIGMCRANYGLGIMKYGEADKWVIEHGGGIDGYITSMSYYPDERTAIALIFNSSHPSIADVSQKVMEIVFNLTDSGSV